MGTVTGTTQDHRHQAEECVAMARRASDETGRALWLTLAQSWVRLAEDVANAARLAPADDSEEDDNESDDDEGGAVILEMPLPDRD